MSICGISEWDEASTLATLAANIGRFSFNKAIYSACTANAVFVKNIQRLENWFMLSFPVILTARI